MLFGLLCVTVKSLPVKWTYTVAVAVGASITILMSFPPSVAVPVVAASQILTFLLSGFAAPDQESTWKPSKDNMPFNFMRTSSGDKLLTDGERKAQ
jgi:hypothetical protein